MADMDDEVATIIATANAELVAASAEMPDDGLVEALAQMQAEESRRMAPFWAEMERSNAELISMLNEIQASPEFQQDLEVLAEMRAADAEVWASLADPGGSPAIRFDRP